LRDFSNSSTVVEPDHETGVRFAALSDDDSGAPETRVETLSVDEVPIRQPLTTSPLPDSLSRAPGFQKGAAKPPGSGRKVGTKNRRTLEAIASFRPLVPGARRALREMLTSSDDELRLKATVIVFSYVFGKPVERRELSGPDGAPVQTENKMTAVTVDATRFAEIVGKMLSGHPHLRRAS
jgi:hypothetical protein